MLIIKSNVFATPQEAEEFMEKFEDAIADVINQYTTKGVPLEMLLAIGTLLGCLMAKNTEFPNKKDAQVRVVLDSIFKAHNDTTVSAPISYGNC